ncbi:DUF2443 family protein [Helicobacter ailurogastricus]|uniref:DUF2443 domain-containing protein n=1 Tax=Helicobacter ailurogastricus TaxID=1578720 RepID=A0A0K2XE68_9HELI|nr:DUF2443 family protein [Helicobacter ailurogastricus]CRF40641.1 hypothetical protein HAL011_04030 [Helicobacter ailurogastricus]CRF43034.1 hypothetical protein HAL013_12580 [Helicobacter ailurogastricus]CRF44263.1 hypothetical protein HAL09_08390 [Helicobacter ailurogastricus]CRF52267.1 hypothetical protein HAL07_03930 [Helicobacter ailurogastricus]BDQ29389.1 hypothetical protein ASB7_12260 [Helicobacter ailurogastricus]
MFERLELIIKDIENAKEEVELLLRIAHLSLSDFILMKRGSLDIPPTLDMAFYTQISERVEELKEAINALNKYKREMLVF